MNERDDRELDSGQRKVQDALRKIAPVRPDPEFRSRLREQFTSGALAAEGEAPVVLAAPEAPTATVVPVRRSRRWWWTVLPIAAALVVSFLVADRGPAWRLHAVQGSGEIVVDGSDLVVGEDMRFDGESDLTTGKDTQLQIASRHILLLEVAPNSDVVLPRPPRRWLHRTMTARVNSGELRVKSGPGFPGRKLIVTTTEGNTEMVGTTISVVKTPDLTCVCVLEGAARIGKDADHMDDIPAGMRKVMFADGRPPLITDIEPTHGAGLELFEESAARSRW